MSGEFCPDQFASSDVCLSGCCRGMLARCHGFSRGVMGVGFKLLEIDDTQREYD